MNDLVSVEDHWPIRDARSPRSHLVIVDQPIRLAGVMWPHPMARHGPKLGHPRCVLKRHRPDVSVAGQFQVHQRFLDQVGPGVLFVRFFQEPL